jgi:hypothetical protein
MGVFLFDAIVTFLVAMLILAKWPSSSLWAIGALVGASVMMGGISRIMIASGIRSGAGRIERLRTASHETILWYSWDHGGDEVKEVTDEYSHRLGRLGRHASRQSIEWNLDFEGGIMATVSSEPRP